MLPASAFSQITTIRHGLQLLSLLQHSAHFFPPQAIFHDGVSFDFIIVGGGTAGCVIANRLTEDKNVNVLLIEAGGDPPIESVSPDNLLHLKRSKYDWNYTSEYEEIFRGCHQKPFYEMFLGKMLGGTSSLNNMIYSRGDPTDYDAWAKSLNNHIWSWENVLPYFVKYEKYDNKFMSHIVPRPDVVGTVYKTDFEFKNFDDYDIKLIDSYAKQSEDSINDDIDKKAFTKPVLNADGSRLSTAWTYLKPIRNRPNLHIYKECLVTKINFDKDKNAVGVTILTNSKKSLNVTARKEIIVSAGAINTPKLLLLSGLGPEEHLKGKHVDVIANIPVGKNLQDHVGVIVPFNTQDKDSDKFRTAITIAYNALNRFQGYPDYESISFWADRELITPLCKNTYQFNNTICDKLNKSNIGRMAYNSEVIHLKPKSRGEVRLRSLFSTDSPVIYTNYFSDSEDLEELSKYVQDFIQLLNPAYFNDAGVKWALGEKCNVNQGNTDYWKCYSKCLFNGLNYYVGTCAMGSVVDSRLKVLGVKKLRIADGSIMPSTVRGDVFGPIVMIGEKVSDMIKEDHHMKKNRF